MAHDKRHPDRLTKINKKETAMSPSTRSFVTRLILQGILFFLMVISLTFFSLLASADEDGDPCRDAGIYIGNHTMLDLWYSLNGGPCTFWGHEHLLILKPDETLVIYRDMACKIEYCRKTPAYDDYKSFDVNHNCRVRLLSDCTPSDM
jgi:hypothetical protein